MEKNKLIDERVTEKSIGCFVYDLKGFKHKPREFNDYDAFFAYSMAVKRLGELEDMVEDGELVSKEWHNEQVGHAELVIEEQRIELEEWAKLFDISNEREYRKKFNEEWKKEYQKKLDERGDGTIAGFPDFDLVYKLYFEQKTEIQQLKGENKANIEAWDIKEDSYKEQLAELQKQVNELTAFKNEAISMSLYGKGRKDGEEVAVKDTAKEIYNEINSCIEQGQDYCGLDWRGLLTAKNIILVYCKKKGVEVES